MRGRTLHRGLLGGLLIFLLVNCPYNLYQVSVLRDTLHVIISLIFCCFFAIYMWLITGFCQRLSTAVNMFRVSSSQSLPLKKIVAHTKPHVFEISVTLTLHFSSEKVLQPSSVFQRAVEISSAARLSGFIYESEVSWLQFSSAEQRCWRQFRGKSKTGQQKQRRLLWVILFIL